MNFQQLRIVRETVRQNYNLTEVANALFTSQSGVSKHIKDLEDELGIELYVRKGKRILGLTEPGQLMLQCVERLLLEANNIKNLAETYSRLDTGSLTIATTHTQARYILPQIITEFKKKYPKVHLKLHQGSPKEIASMLIEGEADIGIATETLATLNELSVFPYYKWHHAIIVPHNHPLANEYQVSLESIANYPIITYHEGFTGRESIENTFKNAQLIPDIVMSALDSDIIKSYVDLGLGIGIIASMAFSQERDFNFKILDAQHLFPINETKIAIKKGHLLRHFAFDFLKLCSPVLTQEFIMNKI